MTATVKTLASLLVLLAVGASAQVRNVPVSTPLFRAAEGMQDGAIAASNGTDFFVAWRDTCGGIMGTRITHDGTVTNRVGGVIAPTPVSSPCSGAAAAMSS